jgi:hypothetical protein
MFEKHTSYTFRYANSKITTEDGLRRRRHVFIFFNRFGQNNLESIKAIDDIIEYYGFVF